MRMKMLHCKFYLAMVSWIVILAATPLCSDAAQSDCAKLLADTPAPMRAATGKPQHLFLIVLENQSFKTTFAKDSPAPYLNCLAAQRGQLLTHYYGIGHHSLDNYIAMVSGQAPTPETQLDCQQYTAFKPDVVLSNGQALWAYCTTKLCSVERRHPFGAATLADEDLAVDFAALTQATDRIAVVATAPLTCDEAWHPFASGELRVFVGGAEHAGR